MEARFISLSKNNGSRPVARRWLVGLVFALSVCLVAAFDLESNRQAPVVLLQFTESPTPSATSTPLVISSADSEEQPTWTATATPRRSTALALTLQAELDLTQTRPPGTPTPFGTIARTPTITPTWYEKTFPTVPLATWPTYTFTPRPTLTKLPTRNVQQTLEQIHKTQTKMAIIGRTLTATAMVDNDILVADMPDINLTDIPSNIPTLQPTVVFSATGGIPLVVNANWLPGVWNASSLPGLLFEGAVPDRRKMYTFQLPDGDPVLLDGQNRQLLAVHPPKNNKDNIQPAISPDGEWVAFSSVPVDDRPRHHLFIVRSDGSEIYQLTKGIYNEEFQPSWSPDGEKVIFISVQYGYYARMYTLDVKWLSKGNSHKPINIYDTEFPLIEWTNINIETAPRYCMAAEKPYIVFSARASSGGRQLYWMKADGKSDPVQLTKDYGNSFPDWSSDCNMLIFVRDKGTPGPEIYIQFVKWDGDPLSPTLVGSPDLLVRNSAGKVYSPHFSSDDSQIVFIHRN